MMTVASDADQLDDGRDQIPERTRGGRRAGRTIAAQSHREVLKRLVEARYVVSRPSMDNVHYIITDQGRKALADVQWH
jgi:DNA-binding PadR family transcriptional regulator